MIPMHSLSIKGLLPSDPLARVSRCCLGVTVQLIWKITYSNRIHLYLSLPLPLPLSLPFALRLSLSFPLLHWSLNGYFYVFFTVRKSGCNIRVIINDVKNINLSNVDCFRHSEGGHQNISVSQQEDRYPILGSHLSNWVTKSRMFN